MGSPQWREPCSQRQKEWTHAGMKNRDTTAVLYILYIPSLFAFFLITQHLQTFTSPSCFPCLCTSSLCGGCRVDLTVPNFWGTFFRSPPPPFTFLPFSPTPDFPLISISNFNKYLLGAYMCQHCSDETSHSCNSCLPQKKDIQKVTTILPGITLALYY